MASVKVACDLQGLGRSSEGFVWLVGPEWMPFTIISAIRCLHYVGGDPLRPNLQEEADDLSILLPTGLHIIGAMANSHLDTAEIARKAEQLRQLLSISSVHQSKIIVAVGSDNLELTFYSYGLGENSYELLEGVRVSQISYGKDISLLRCRMCLSHSVYSAGTEDYRKQINEIVDGIICNLTGTEIAFLVKNKDASKIFWPAQVASYNGNDPISSLMSDSTFMTPGEYVIPEPLDIEILMTRSKSADHVPAPVLKYIPALGTSVGFVQLDLDLLCFEPCESSILQSITSKIIPSLCRQLKIMAKTLKPQLHAFHFCPPGLLHPVTVFYDLRYGEAVAGLLETRKQLHHRLGLPMDRPLLRVANSLIFRKEDTKLSLSEGSKRLVDVHLGISMSVVNGGEISTIQGSYEYYHYLQNRCDDTGWGCAYRSLQTIVSWFKLQNYTDLPVPSHREIQQILVDIGDKEASFVGSQEWIGAIELSFILDKLLGVTSKILNLPSGADMPEKCRDLAAHFRTQGTPVMIGGGVLAYTLLGVHYNEHTGDCAFLILDPHYTGKEDLKTIHNGGWCAWRKAVSTTGKEFFLRNKFYNLLLPQRPMTV